MCTGRCLCSVCVFVHACIKQAVSNAAQGSIFPCGTFSETHTLTLWSDFFLHLTQIESQGILSFEIRTQSQSHLACINTQHRQTQNPIQVCIQIRRFYRKCMSVCAKRGASRGVALSKSCFIQCLVKCGISKPQRESNFGVRCEQTQREMLHKIKMWASLPAHIISDTVPVHTAHCPSWQ